LIWLNSKNLSNVAKHFVDHINDNKTNIMKIHFDWFSAY
ncbi:MAG: ferritin, partial [Candidatus Paceibacteria bacterium]